ncbi:hypothetical protein ACFRI7_31990 [Streptomyces sp. NPDC056716]|uniref:hypothetical protein n=1 Tax=unclassified Streptomyces TaxID=2593676 RepID=UPI0036A2BF44
MPETTVDFTAVAPREIPDRPSPAEPPAPEHRATRDEGRHREAEQARAGPREADAVLQRRERELATAQHAQTTAEGKAREAADQVRRLEHELQEARRARSRTETDTASAAKAVEAAKRALGDARRAAERIEPQRGR